ncbi:response regulator [Rubinisphaera brasiliensis]|uniref:Response regulator receiver n=1 Tax=Rubinisphaera brasiliensis (strain ATCC 49424 / DSM 5305 / JCM 21570 / IAM 15109 / NBRC 103401 / IFAM 1448) TaxID=756272 RepID=F0SP74_RUBBR|nr:response regulator [Rubinisphaera brasiliensis]ADY61177.1 response regulator receiver [Rubinisphaera brasiliensis DSM 5305]
MTLTSRHVVVLEDCDEDFATVKEASTQWSQPVRITRFTQLQPALEAIEQESFEPPVLFLLDLSVPGGSGLELLQAIKKHARLRVIPTVILSTTDNPAEIRSCYKAHANAFHMKEMETPRMVNLVSSIFQYWLGRVRLVDPARNLLRG